MLRKIMGLILSIVLLASSFTGMLAAGLFCIENICINHLLLGLWIIMVSISVIFVLTIIILAYIVHIFDLGCYIREVEE